MSFANFKLDFDSGIPIYVQLKEQIKYAIATGRFPPGSQLPTVRQLAVSLRINVNTVSRVYSELESEGVLATRQGKGTFVLDVKSDEDASLRRRKLDCLLDGLIVEAFNLGFSPDEVLRKLEQKLEAYKREEKGM